VRTLLLPSFERTGLFFTEHLTHSGQKRPLAAHPESYKNSAIFGPIKKIVVYTHILRCWKHIFGKKLKIGQKLQKLRYIYSNISGKFLEMS